MTTWQTMSEEELRETMRREYSHTANFHSAAQELNERVAAQTLSLVQRMEWANRLSPAALAIAQAVSEGRQVNPDGLRNMAAEVVRLVPPPRAPTFAERTKQAGERVVQMRETLGRNRDASIGLRLNHEP